MGWAAGRLSSRAIRLELGPGSGAHTWHLRLWSKATRSQCTEGLGGEKGAERVAKVRRLRREGALCPISDGGCTRVKELEPLHRGAARVYTDLGLGQGRPYIELGC